MKGDYMLYQGDRIICKIDEKTITGTVCGKCTEEQPFIGGMYIIAPDESISNETYPFTHFAMPEVLLSRKEK